MGLWGKLKKNVNRGLTKMHLESVREQLNVKKLVTNPKGYFSDQLKAYGRDTKFGVSVYKRWVSGEWGSLAKEATSDTMKAIGRGGAESDAAGTLAGVVGDTVAEIKGAKKGAGESSAPENAANEGDMGLKFNLGKVAQTIKVGAELYQSYKGQSGAAADAQGGGGGVAGLLASLSDEKSPASRLLATATAGNKGFDNRLTYSDQGRAALSVNTKMAAAPSSSPFLASAPMPTSIPPPRGGLLDIILSIFGL